MYKSYSRHNGDKELGAISVGTSIGHTDSVRSIMFEAGMKLVFKFSSPY